MLKSLLAEDRLLIAPGVFDGLSARLGARAGFDLLYMSGFSVAGATWGKPDIGLLTAGEMTDAAARVVDAASGLPVIADGDNGYGGPLNVARTVEAYEKAGVACIQLEDQVHPKRCGHMENKQVVSRDEAVEKIRAAVSARSDPAFLVMARTDSRATDSLKEALVRAELFLQAGADILFVEAPRSEAEMATVAATFRGTPLVINLVEDGKTPWPTREVLRQMGYSIALYPVTALLHLAQNLAETYAAIAAGSTPTATRKTFGAFNELVGLNEANAQIDYIRGNRPNRE
ncbi:MAG: oxaloacetate decarboxylase [Pseudomonadota bacterium]